MSYLRNFINQQYYDRFIEVDKSYVEEKIKDGQNITFREDIATILYELDDKGQKKIGNYLKTFNSIFTKDNFKLFIEMLRALDQQGQVSTVPKKYAKEINSMLKKHKIRT